MAEVFSTVKEFSPLIYAGTAIVSAVGLLPRFGPGLAVWLSLRSPKPVPLSIRSAEISLLKTMLTDKVFSEAYIVVTGEKGVGKSCLLDTLTSKTAGVIKIEAKPNHTQIIENTQKALTSPPFNMRPITSAPRVLFWFRLFNGGRSPLVVINATEREPTDGYAGLTGAARTLVGNLNLRVVVDGSPNSLSDSLLQTTRQQVLDINPMTKEMIWKMSQLEDFFKFVEKAGLDDTAFAVLGGIPSRYLELWRNSKIQLQNGQDPREVIGYHLCAQVYAAIMLVKNSKTSKDMKGILELFNKDRLWMPSHILADKDLKRPIPDKVFREVKRYGVPVLIPASNAIGIVLRHSLTKEPSLNELEELIKHKLSIEGLRLTVTL